MHLKFFLSIFVEVLFSLTFLKGSQAQQFLDTSSVWSVWYDCTGEGGGNTGFRVRLAEPVDSAGVWQSDIWFSRNQNPDEWIPYFGKLKEDSLGNIYWNNALLYDFTLIPGDTFGDMRCSIVDSVLLDGTYRQRWIFECLSGYDSADFWIEGIGSTMHGLFYPGNWMCTLIVGAPLTELICFHQAGNLLFMNPSFGTCLQSSLTYAPEEWPYGQGNYWNYNFEEQNQWGGINLGNTCIRYVKDTLMNGEACHKYHAKTVNNLDQTLGDIPFYLKQYGTALHYSFGGQFFKLFDLEADPGDSWSVRNPYEIYGLTPEPDSMTTFSVDSVFYTLPWWGWDPFVYRNVVISSSSSWKFKLPVMEVTGGRWFFFPGRWDEWESGKPSLLRCCNNHSWEPPTFGYLFPCFYLNTATEEKDPDEFLVLTYSDHLEIECNRVLPDNITICLYDCYGRLQYQLVALTQQRILIPLTSLSSGIYLLRFIQNNRDIFIRKVFKP